MATGPAACVGVSHGSASCARCTHVGVGARVLLALGVVQHARPGSGRAGAGPRRRTCRPARRAPSGASASRTGRGCRSGARSRSGTTTIASTNAKPLWAMPPAMSCDELLVGAGGAAGHVGRARGVSQLADVEGLLDVAVDARRRAVALEGGGAHLAAGHAVDRVVEDERGDVDVAPRGVDEVVAADRRRSRRRP